MENLPSKKLLTRNEAAECLGVTPGTLAVWASTRRYPLPFVKVGRSVKYNPDDIAEFIRTRTVHQVEVEA